MELRIAREEYRNKGIGTQLSKKVIEWAKISGIELLFLWPSKRAAAFFERTGFSSQNKL